MDKSMFIKIVKNKKNGQINASFPKKELPKDCIKDLDKITKFRINLEDWE